MTGPERGAYAATTFEEFWPHYLQMHSRRETQLLHLAGTSAALALAATGALTGHPSLILLAPLADHALAQLGHRLFEQNLTRPWRHFPWHARAELRLAWRVLRSLPRSGGFTWRVLPTSAGHHRLARPRRGRRPSATIQNIESALARREALVLSVADRQRSQ